MDMFYVLCSFFKYAMDVIETLSIVVKLRTEKYELHKLPRKRLSLLGWFIYDASRMKSYGNSRLGNKRTLESHDLNPRMT